MEKIFKYFQTSASFLGAMLFFHTGTLQGQIPTQNYVRTRIMLNETATKYIDQIQYVDGFGAPFLQVSKSDKIVASLQEYDEIGRESKTWLPLPITEDYVTPAIIKSQIPSYYKNDMRPFNESIYDSSPLNRVIAQYGPGYEWANKPVLTEYLTNQISGELSCKHYAVDNAGRLIDNGYYEKASLNIVKKVDEDGNVAYSFTNMQGKQLLTRQISEAINHDTYYVYDDLDNLGFVLSPMYQQQPDLNAFAYQYRYNGSHCCIWKKLPGCGPVINVYDKVDRLIFSQDSVQRSQSIPAWTFYLYDQFGRNTIYGECNNTNVAEAENIVVKSTFSVSGNSIAGSGYTSNFTLASPRIYKVSYYDNYNFLELLPFTDRTKYPLPTVLAKGLITGEKDWQDVVYYYDSLGRPIQSVGSKISESTSFSFTGQPLSTQRKYHITLLNRRIKDPRETYYYHYDAQDRLIKTEHQMNDSSVIVLAENVYDELGRLKTKKLHNGTMPIDYTYNIRNWINSISGLFFKEHLYYNSGPSIHCYNGNISALDWQSGNSQTLSGYKFTYDGLNRLTSAAYGEGTGYTANLNRFNEFIDQYDLNGNIKRLRRYGKLGENSYGLLDDLTLSYNGNQLKSIEDAASDPLYYGVCNFMDGSKNKEKEYFYNGNGNLTQDYNKGIAFIKYNRLNQPSTMQFKDGHMIQYQYDSNGIKVGSTYTTAIPGIIIPMGGRTGEDEEDLYPLEMSKIQNNSYYHNLVDYGSKFTISTPEGYITFKLKGTNRYSSTYHYYLKDHQGNNRVVVNQDGRTVEQINHYYPFGGSFGDELDISDEQPFKFSGKELDRMYGLDWYDFGARPYDRSSGCFPSTMDPLCEKYYSISPYVYCMNNPVNYMDPDGRDVIISDSLKDMALTQLQNAVGEGVTLVLTAEGRLCYTLNSNQELSGNAKTVINIIDNSDIIINMRATEGMFTSSGNLFVGGAFLGNTISRDQEGNPIADGFQEVNPKVMEALDMALDDYGGTVLHELTESYEGARMSRAIGTSSGNSKQKNSIYSTAHTSATRQKATRIYEYWYDLNGNITGNINSAVKANWVVTDKNGNRKIIQTLK